MTFLKADTTVLLFNPLQHTCAAYTAVLNVTPSLSSRRRAMPHSGLHASTSGIHMRVQSTLEIREIKNTNWVPVFAGMTVVFY
jgi:hypothetical protein